MLSNALCVSMIEKVRLLAPRGQIPPDLETWEHGPWRSEQMSRVGQVNWIQ